MRKVVIVWFRGFGLAVFVDRMKPPFDRICSYTINIVFLFVRIQVKILKRVVVKPDGSLLEVVEQTAPGLAEVSET